ncbi:hypothetical protein [Burkholderia ubonensis]|uniref:hypothetical protein n=1 Tax=Burkholderia ubonensis TaxID=101571 RepID=UPI000A448779|nr:hypothetical protein [Burkholderia ubonensis]
MAGSRDRRASQNRMRGIATINWRRAKAFDIVTGFPTHGRAAPAAVPPLSAAARSPHCHRAMTDRIFVKAVAPDGQPVNLVVRDGRFVAIGPDCAPFTPALRFAR